MRGVYVSRSLCTPWIPDLDDKLSKNRLTCVSPTSAYRIICRLFQFIAASVIFFFLTQGATAEEKMVSFIDNATEHLFGISNDTMWNLKR